MSEFLTIIKPNPQSQRVIILIPDIWGMTDYNQATAESFASDYQMPCYVLDYFYQLTNTSSRFDPNTDAPTATSLMNKMTGEDFIAIFNKAIAEIKSGQPNLSEIVVIGFCFGGRLAYLTAQEQSVKKIVSFYGAGALTENFYNSRSPLELLANARKGDPSFKFLAFFGQQDNTIPASDQATILQKLTEAGISYEHHDYPAGHAYFQKGRPNYNLESAKQSKIVLDKFILNL